MMGRLQNVFKLSLPGLSGQSRGFYQRVFRFLDSPNKSGNDGGVVAQCSTLCHCEERSEKIVSLRGVPAGDDEANLSNNVGQATLEFTLIFVILAALLMGLLGLWKWSADNIVKRQQRYNATRLEEGSRARDDAGEAAPFEAAPITDEKINFFKN